MKDVATVAKQPSHELDHRSISWQVSDIVPNPDHLQLQTDAEPVQCVWPGIECVLSRLEAEARPSAAAHWVVVEVNSLAEPRRLGTVQLFPPSLKLTDREAECRRRCIHGHAASPEQLHLRQAKSLARFATRI